MGYDVHITRRDDWWEEGGPEISRAEWFHYINNDTSLQLSRSVIVENNKGDPVSLKADSLAVWLEWPHREEGVSESLLWHSEGNIYAKNPDRETLAKMHAIAGTLKAKVQGDDGEVYGASGELRGLKSGRQPWWKVW